MAAPFPKAGQSIARRPESREQVWTGQTDGPAWRVRYPDPSLMLDIVHGYVKCAMREICLQVSLDYAIGIAKDLARSEPLE